MYTFRQVRLLCSTPIVSSSAEEHFRLSKQQEVRLISSGGTVDSRVFRLNDVLQLPGGCGVKVAITDREKQYQTAPLGIEAMTSRNDFLPSVQEQAKEWLFGYTQNERQMARMFAVRFIHLGGNF